MNALRSNRRPNSAHFPYLSVHGITIACLIVGIFAPTSVVAEQKFVGLAAALERRLNEPKTSSTESFTPILKRFYSERAYQPIWITASKPNSRAVALRDTLARAAAEGLDPKGYALPSAHDESPASLELGYSETFARYVTDILAGRRAPQLVDPELFLFERHVDLINVLYGLVRAQDAQEYLGSIYPQSAEYKKLRDALALYRSLEDRGGWRAVPVGPVLKPGMTDSSVEIVRERLEQTGDIEIKESDRSTYDDDLANAVRSIQSRLGLKSDGVVGRQTVAALNVLVRQRVLQIVLNMERARWMPDDLGEEYILVNVADFSLEAMARGRTALEMRVIIGKPYRRTPVFSQKLSHLEFNPSWTVPPRIALLDLLPKLKADPDYFSNEGIVVYEGWRKDSRQVDPSEIDWRRYSMRTFPFRLQQMPGPKNALGRVKFMLPNKFDVYLHDTPAKELFGNASRAFSSGCIRVENPMELVDFVLQDQPEWTRERIEMVLQEGKTRVVPIRRPIMVHLAYSTAWVDATGQLHFRDDIYKRDQRLAAALGLTQ